MYICMYMYVYVCICMYMYVYVCICMYMYVYVCICIYICCISNMGLYIVTMYLIVMERIEGIIYICILYERMNE